MTADNPIIEKPGLFSLALNYVPLLHILLGVWLGSKTGSTAAALALFALCWIYVLPPLAARLLMALFGRPEGECTQDQAAYRVWWAITQLQVPFNRFPFLEELLRLVPGLYSIWIWLWGGKLSPFAYVAPGATITDRFAVHVGRGAILGMGSALAGHMVTRNTRGNWVILVAVPSVGAEAIVGGEARLGPGAVLAPGATLPYGRKLGPYAAWPRPKPGPPA